MQGPSSATSSALPKGLSQPPWSPRGLAGPPALLPSLESPPELLGAERNKDPPKKRKEKSNITHLHMELLLECSGSSHPPAVGDMGRCPEGTRTWVWWGQAPQCPPLPWKLLGLMELQPPERHTLVNVAHEGLQKGPEYLEQGWEQERGQGQLELNGENNSLLGQVPLTGSTQLPAPREPGESLATPNTIPNASW